MGKLLLLIAIAISLSASSQQKKDTVQPKTFALVGNEASFNYLLQILAESSLNYKGKPLSYLEVSELIKWLQTAKELATEPKKK